MALCFWVSPVYAEKSSHILILSNSTEAPYQEAVQGFKEYFPSRNNIKITELTLAQAQSGNEIERLNPDVIYSLGTDATAWASLQTARIPIVATMMLKADIFRKTSNITGVSLGHSFTTQFQWLKKFFPLQKTVAVLFNPSENAATVQEVMLASQQNGLKLVAIPVGSPKELPFALDRLSQNIDVLLAIPDETAMSVNTAKEVLLASFRNKVPMVGLSDNWVKSGAFYSLSWDYLDLGQQCATLAQKILNGSPVQAIPHEQPRKVTYAVNTKIAEHMNIEIPEELVKKAKLVFN